MLGVNSFKLLLIATVFQLFLFINPLHATSITFEGFGGNTIFGNEITGDGLEVATLNGFNFVSSGDHFHIGSGLGSVPSNGTSILLQDRNYSISMSQSSGEPFSLLSADLGENTSYDASAIDIVIQGFFSGGGSITTTYTLDGNSSLFENVFFTGFSDLSYVVFDGTGNGDGDYLVNGFTLDNLVVTSPIPEPSTFLLLGGGMATLAFYARRKKKG